MAEVRSCPRCKKLFNYIPTSLGRNICPTCMDEMDEKFKTVKNYVYRNPHVTMATLCNELNVTPNMITKWVREERLQFAEDSDITIDCKKCGKVIRCGDFCPSCAKEMINGLGGEKLKTLILDPEPQTSKSKMFIDLRK